jgi:hypothetical protein
MSSSDFVDFSEFQAANLIISPFQQKQSKAEQGQKAISYYEVPLSYNHGTSDAPVIGDLLFQYPEMTTNSGLAEGTVGNRKTYSVPMQFSLISADHTKAIEALKSIYDATAIYVKTVRGKVGVPHFDNNLAEATGYRFPLHYPKDPDTQEVVKGKNPSCYLKLKYAEYGNRVDKTLFTDRKGRSLDWSLLENVDMKFIPLVKLEKLYIGGGKIRLQMKCTSAIVTSIVPKGSVSPQMRTIKRLQQDHEANELFERQLEAIREAKLMNSQRVATMNYQSDSAVKTLDDILDE